MKLIPILMAISVTGLTPRRAIPWALFKEPHEIANTNTIGDLTEYIKTYFKTHHNHSMDGLTPRILQDWHRIVHKPQAMFLEVQKSLMHSVVGRGASISPLTLVCLELTSWRESLTHRRDSLRLTGYENIDL